MTPPPTLTELQALAERALAHLDGEGQVTVLWERRLAGRGGSAEGGERASVVVTRVEDGRAGRAEARGEEDGELRRAARAAALQARSARAWPTPGLPAPVPARAHDGFDPALAQVAPGELGARLSRHDGRDGLELRWRAGAARLAIASTRGTLACEQRTYVESEALAGDGERRVIVRVAAIGPDGIDAEGALQEAAALSARPSGDAAGPWTAPPGTRPPEDLPAGECPVVLGPAAVATVLDHLRPAFGVDLALRAGPLYGRLGTRVAAAAVNLSDSPRHPATLPRSLDAEGLGRRPVPLIQDGVAHRAVHDTASAHRAATASTGHATRAAALAPLPENLVLVGGGAAGVRELCGGLEAGLYVPALDAGSEQVAGRFRHVVRGAVVIRGGELAAPLRDGRIEIEPLRVLAGVQALTSAVRLVALPGHCPGGVGAAVVPALCTGSGVRVLPRGE